MTSNRIKRISSGVFMDEDFFTISSKLRRNNVLLLPSTLQGDVQVSHPPDFAVRNAINSSGMLDSGAKHVPLGFLVTGD